MCTRMAFAGLMASCALALSATEPLETLESALAKPVLPPTAGLSAWDALYMAVDAADAAADDAWRQCATPAAFDARRMELRAKMVEAIGGFPERTPLHAEVTGSIARNGYRVEKVLFQSLPGAYVTCSLYLPDSPEFKPPYPACLFLCGHSFAGKAQCKYSRAGVMMAQRGVAAFITDPVRQGERRSVTDEKTSPTVHHAEIGVNAELLGHGLAAFEIFDAMRALDYLETRADIRKDGFGCSGNSGGGTQTAMLCALEDRITVSAPCCYIGSLRTQNYARGLADCEQLIRGQLTFGLNHAGYLLMSRSALCLHGARNDMIPFYGTCDTWRTVKAAAGNVSRGDMYAFLSVAGPHGLYESHRTSIVAWMRRHLLGDVSAMPEGAPACFARMDDGFSLADADCGPSEEELFATRSGRTCDLPGFKSEHDFLREECRAARKTFDVSAIRGSLPRVRVDGCGAPRVLSRSRGKGFSVVREAYWVKDGFSIPSVTVAPDVAKGNDVLLVGDGARKNMTDIVRRRIGDGVSMTVLDLMGYGETGKSRNNLSRKAGDDEEMGKMLYLLGSSLVARRMEQVIAVAREMNARTGRKVELVAKGRAVIPAVHAFAAEPGLFKSIEMVNPPKSWTATVEAGEPSFYADIVPGALLRYDWTDLASLQP